MTNKKAVKKMVIFVGGTSYSGSTMLDMILSNDPKGYSLGEIIALFRPTQKHHFGELKKVKGESEKWNKILSDKESNLYRNLFDTFPAVDYFVDSSKSPLWIQKQSKILEKEGIIVKNLLIYKEPIDIAYSFKRRERYKDWKRTWINYHRLYFTLISDFKTISYKDFVKNGNLLKEVCEFAGIKYFDKKEEFWTKEHHTFFGNRRARVHTSNLEVKKDKEFLSLDDKKDHKKIYYKEVDDEDVIKEVDKLLMSDKRFEWVLNYLKVKDFSKKEVKNMPSKIPNFKKYSVLLRKLKRQTQRVLVFRNN